MVGSTIHSVITAGQVVGAAHGTTRVVVGRVVGDVEQRVAHGVGGTQVRRDDGIAAGIHVGVARPRTAGKAACAFRVYRRAHGEIEIESIEKDALIDLGQNQRGQRDVTDRLGTR